MNTVSIKHKHSDTHITGRVCMQSYVQTDGVRAVTYCLYLCMCIDVCIIGLTSKGVRGTMICKICAENRLTVDGYLCSILECLFGGFF